MDSNNMKEFWGRASYGKLQEIWPKTEDGDFEEQVFLKHCASTDMEDELLINMLSAYGIPCVSQYSNDGILGRVVLGMSGTGTDLFVPKSMLEDARKLCEGGHEDGEEL